MNRRKRLGLSAASLLTGLAAMTAQTLTLQECIHIGLERNLTVRSTQVEIVKSEVSIRESRARLLPTVGATMQAAWYPEEAVNTTTGALVGNGFPDNPTWQKVHSMPWQASALLSVQMPLWNESLRAATDAARTVKELRSLSHEKAREELTVQIARVYYLAQGAKEQVNLLDKDIRRMEELREITAALLEQGVVMEVDFRRIGISIANLQTQREQMQTLHEQQLNTLRFLLDYDEKVPVEVAPQDTSIIYNKVKEGSLSPSLPDERMAATRLTLIDRQRRTVSKGYLPTLALFGQAGYLGYQEEAGDFFSRHDSHWYGMAVLGLKLSVPIFDANQKRMKLQQYKHEATQAELAMQSLHRRNKQLYANARLQLLQNERICLTQTGNRQQAHDVYELTAMRYREGVASMTELLQDDMRLTTAEQQVANARTQWNLANVELMRLEERLEELQ